MYMGIIFMTSQSVGNPGEQQQWRPCFTAAQRVKIMLKFRTLIITYQGLGDQNSFPLNFTKRSTCLESFSPEPNL